MIHDNMTKSKTNWIAIAVGALVLINIGLVASIWLQRNSDKPEASGPMPGDRNPLATQLGFDSVQRRQFDTLRARHFALAQGYREELRSLKERYFEGIKTGAAANDSLAQAMAQVQAKLDRSTYEHFMQVRALCNEGQKNTFDRMLMRIINAMGKQGRREGPPPGERGDRPDDRRPHDGPPDSMPDGPPRDGPPEGHDGPPRENI